jgi:hypothetical protein
LAEGISFQQQLGIGNYQHQNYQHQQHPPQKSQSTIVNSFAQADEFGPSVCDMPSVSATLSDMPSVSEHMIDARPQDSSLCAAFDKMALEKEMIRNFVETFASGDEENGADGSAATQAISAAGGEAAVEGAAVEGAAVEGAAVEGAAQRHIEEQALFPGGAGGAGGAVAYAGPGVHVVAAPMKITLGAVGGGAAADMEELFNSIYLPGGAYNQVCPLSPPPSLHTS